MIADNVVEEDMHPVLIYSVPTLFTGSGTAVVLNATIAAHVNILSVVFLLDMKSQNVVTSLHENY